MRMPGRLAAVGVIASITSLVVGVGLILFVPWRVALIVVLLLVMGSVAAILIYLRKLIILQSESVRALLYKESERQTRAKAQEVKDLDRRLKKVEEGLREVPERVSLKTAIDIGRARKAILEEISRTLTPEEADR